MADDEPMEPFDLTASHIAAAQGKLEAARRTGRSGAIALAHIELAATMAGAGATASAVREFTDVIAYLDLAKGDQESETRRWLRMTSPAAPPPQADDYDPVVLQAIARIHLAECQLELGDRAAAAEQLDLAAPVTRGLGRGQLRKRAAQVRRRMAAAADPDSDPHPAAAEAGIEGPLGLPEQLAAADELLGHGRFHEAARVALSVIGQCGDGDLALRGQARQVLGVALESMEQQPDAAAVLQGSFDDYAGADQDEAAARVAIHLAWRLEQLDRSRDAVGVLQRALPLTQPAGLAPLRAQLLTDLGSLLDQTGDRAGAQHTFEGAVAVSEQSGDEELVANARHGLAVVLGASGSSDREDEVEALSLLDRCRDDYDRLGLADRAAGCEHEAAALLGRLGSLDAAGIRYQRALERYGQLPDEQQDTGSWPDEVADVRRNLAALASDRTREVGLFASGGHQMHHRSDATAP